MTVFGLIDLVMAIIFGYKIFIFGAKMFFFGYKTIMLKFAQPFGLS